MASRSALDPRHDPFNALGDAHRRTIVELLGARERSVQELAELLPISRPAVSRHLRLLKDAGEVCVGLPVGGSEASFVDVVHERGEIADIDIDTSPTGRTHRQWLTRLITASDGAVGVRHARRGGGASLRHDLSRGGRLDWTPP